MHFISRLNGQMFIKFRDVPSQYINSNSLRVLSLRFLIQQPKHRSTVFADNESRDGVEIGCMGADRDSYGGSGRSHTNTAEPVHPTRIVRKY